MSFSSPFPSELPLIKLKRTVTAGGSVKVIVLAPTCFRASPLGEYDDDCEYFLEFRYPNLVKWQESCLLAAYEQFLNDVAKIQAEYSDEIEYKEVEDYHRMSVGIRSNCTWADLIVEPLDAYNLENNLKACADDLVRYMLEVQAKFEESQASQAIVSEEIA